LTARRQAALSDAALTESMDKFLKKRYNPD
jgi:hypothetical protein